jgi:hypothetical protein
MRAAVWVIALVLTGAVGACGGSDDNGGTTGAGRQPAGGSAQTKGNGSARDQIEQTVREFVSALNAADGDRACPLLTNNGEGVLAGVLPSDQADRDCKEVIKRVGGRWTDLQRYRVTKVTPAGERATARIISRRPRYESDLLLVVADGGWKITYPPAVLEKVPRPPGVPLGDDIP